MLGASVVVARRRIVSSAVRAQSTQAKGSRLDEGGAIAADGRHEMWREGMSDHDNEPK